MSVNIAGGQVAGKINCPASGTYTLPPTVTAIPTCSLVVLGTSTSAPLHSLL
jgi:hypothetical protein